MSQFLWYDCTFKKQCTVPVTLTFDLLFFCMKVIFCCWIDYDPIGVLYEFQIDICSNIRYIKYRNMGIGLLHVKRRPRQKWRQMTFDSHQI